MKTTGRQGQVRLTKLAHLSWNAVLVAAVVTGNGWLDAAEEANQAGLRGILPDGVPAELTSDMATLPDTWKDWGSAFKDELSALYEKPDAGIAEQRQAIAALRKRVASARKHITDSRYRSIVNVLVSISGGLERRLDVAEAALNTLVGEPERRAPQLSALGKRVSPETQVRATLATSNASSDSPELRQDLKDLLAALEDYESEHSTATAAAVRKSFEAVRPLAPDGADRIGLALRKSYFNYNLRVVASEAYLNKFADQSRDDAGPVRDFILGADVYGNQTTHTDVSLNLVPSSGTAQFDVVARGVVASSTQGYTDQATIETSGNHYYTAAKRVAFDGEKFSTGPARISVNANNMTTGAQTNVNFPILRGIANGVAVARAEEMRPESESIAASRVQERVLPQFNAQVDKEVREANSKVSARIQALRELNLYPDAKTWSTTESELRFAGRLMGAQELGGSDPDPAMYLGRGVTVLVHDSLMNHYADDLDLAGKSMTDDEIKTKIKDQLSKLLDREIKFSNDQPAPADESRIKTIVFDNSDPLRMHAEDGALVLTIRAGFKQEDKEDIPTQVITMPLKFTVNMKNIIVEPANISIEAADKSSNPGQQLARAGVIRKKLDAAFPRREIERVQHVQRKYRNVMTAVTRIRALDSWLSVTYE